MFQIMLPTRVRKCISEYSNGNASEDALLTDRLLASRKSSGGHKQLGLGWPLRDPSSTAQETGLAGKGVGRNRYGGGIVYALSRGNIAKLSARAETGKSRGSRLNSPLAPYARSECPDEVARKRAMKGVRTTEATGQISSRYLTQ